MLIGTFINMILYGVCLVPVYYLFIVETLNTACDIQMMYQPLIQNFVFAAGEAFPRVDGLLNTWWLTKPSFLLHASFAYSFFFLEPIVIVAVSTPIQFFFAWRVRLLTKSNWLGAIICLFALISLAGGIWTTALIIQVKVFARKIELHWSALVWFLAACISDVLITTVLVVTLSRRKTGFAATDDAIQRIIRMTVQTGALTAICAIGDVVFFMSTSILARKENIRQISHLSLMSCTAYSSVRAFMNFLWDLALSKLYANCLLSTLNARGGNFNKDGGNNNSSSPSGGTRNQRERGQLGGVRELWSWAFVRV
ncbi:hypothetical protein FA15DRAFT_682075 [Coprinopsis marcescibilis]|uniref:DUF6534 domain-containing protein n=1 Tax=Coprinopsis marcescibilis TaxID=230819 RepID=A0A5C3KMG9_COPMA|nr:hypothetical protein FA15DRAFT_682075 [Coprinopsis marcescibilis]